MDLRNFTRVFLILLCFKSYLAHEPYRSNHIRVTSFETVEEDRSLANHVIEVVHETFPINCGFACLQTTGCQSYNLREKNPELYECELSSSTKTKHPNDFTTVTGTTYYGSDNFHGLGCAAANCPNENCKETKSYPYYECQDNAFDKSVNCSSNHTVKIDRSTALEQISICFWCKTSNTLSAFLSYKSASNSGSVLNLLYANGFVTLQINDENHWDAIFEIPPIHDNQWHHVCTTWNSSDGNVNIYVDGAMRTYPSGYPYFKDEKITADGTFKIGKFTSGQSQFNYTGMLSQFNIWDYVLPGKDLMEIARNCTLSPGAGGNIVKWGRDFVPTQSDAAEPRNCRQRELVKLDSELHFPGQRWYHTSPKMPSLNQFTISWWLKTSWNPTDGSAKAMTIASFSTSKNVLLITIKTAFQLRFEIDGVESIHNLPPISDDRWHHMAITWTTDGGRWDFFLDGAHRSSIDDIRSGHVIASQSTLVLGENEHTSNKHLYGSLSRFNVWDKRFSMELIVALARDPGHDQGNVISWKNVLESLKYYVSHTEPSTVASSAGKSNIALTLTQKSAQNYAIIPYSGGEIGKLTVCAWIDLSYTDEYPSLVSYSAVTTNDFFIEFANSKLKWYLHNTLLILGSDSEVNGHKWRHFCATWDTSLGEVHWYLEGTEKFSKADLPKNQPLAGGGLWAFTNDQDSHGGGFQSWQSFTDSVAQINVWNYVLPVKAMHGLSYGGTTIEGNLLRWTDIVANYNSDGYFSKTRFHLYMQNAVVQNKRDKFCRESNYPCDADDTLYARIGPSFDSTEGLQLRCYCKVNVQHDKNVELITSNFYSKESTLITIF